MSRAHGIESTWSDLLWVADEKSPQWYPDAVGLRPGVPAAVVAGALKDRPNAAVKDAFTDIDLSEHGFGEMFQARWITAESAGGDAGWEVVRSPDRLRVWASAWGGGEVFVPRLLEDQAVAMVAEFSGGRAVRGAVLNLAADVVGVSNMFDVEDVSVATWTAVAATAARLWPDTPLVGYESGPDLSVAREAGFVELGRLRVWAR